MDRLSPARFPVVTVLPPAADNPGLVFEMGNKLWFSDATNWIDLGATGGGSSSMEAITVTGNITLDATALNACVEKNVSGSYTATLPAGLGSRMDAITFLNSSTSGNLTIGRDTGVTLYRSTSNANIAITPGTMVTIILSATVDKWIAG